MMTSRNTCSVSMVLVLLLAGLALGHATTNTPNSVNYIAVGYDIIKGNPDGDPVNSGGVDPGLHASRNIFELTYDKGKMSKDNKYRYPDQTEFLQRSSAFTTKESTTFHGTASYAKKLANSVAVSASVESIFASVEFAASHGYEKIANEEKAEGYVYFSTETIENLGHIRFLTELAQADGYGVSRSFAAAVCKLPIAYDRGAYMTFIGEWGTHVVTKLDSGIRSGKTYRATRSSFVKLASEETSNSVSLGGSYGIGSASLAVDMGRFKQDESTEKKFGSESTNYKVGSPSLHEPISLTLIGLQEALKAEFWTRQNSYEQQNLCPSGWNRQAVAANILTGLKGYADYLKVKPSSDPVVSLPLTWPDGTYALPKPARNSGSCPDTDYLTWDQGNRVEITENLGANWWDKSQHLTDHISQGSITLYFCVKTSAKSSKTSWEWMPGTYCILQFGNMCPNGFETGSLKFDDWNTPRNKVNGILPEGEYTTAYTIIHYCCRSDASASHPIFLPTASPFYLLRRYDTCQKVSGMTDTAEFIELDTEYGPDNADEEHGAFPEPGAVDNTRVKIWYCYYQPDATTAKRVADALALEEEEKEVEEFLNLLEKQNHVEQKRPHDEQTIMLGRQSVSGRQTARGLPNERVHDEKKVDELLDFLEKLVQLED